MTKRKSDFTLTTLDDLFTTQEMRDEAKLEKVQNIPLEDLQPFENHPFKVADANLQRETILPSEKAFAYKMKLEALKHQGRTSRQVVGKSESADMVSNTESGRQVQRFIRLTELIPQLLEMVDEKKIAFNIGVELSYLQKDEQKDLLDTIESEDCTPSLSQAQRMKKLSQSGELSMDVIFGIMTEEKANQKEQLRFMEEDIRKYFPRNYTKADMQKTIISLLEKWQRQRERNRRDER